MTASTEYFHLPHATPQRRDVKFFFANQRNARKNITQGQLSQSNIVSSLQALQGYELLRMRLSTPLTASKSNRALSTFRFSTIFKYEARKPKLRIFRKTLETASIIRSLKRSNSADGTRQESSCTRRERGEGLALASRTAWAFSCRIRSYTACSLSRTGASPGSTSCARGLEARRRGRGCRSYRRHK